MHFVWSHSYMEISHGLRVEKLKFTYPFVQIALSATTQIEVEQARHVTPTLEVSHSISISDPILPMAQLEAA